MELIHHIIENQDILKRLKDEVRHEVRHATNKLYSELEEIFPEVIKAVQHKRGAYYMINRLRGFITTMIEDGLLDFKEAKFFLHRLNKENKNLMLNKMKIDFEEVSTDFQSNCELAKIFSQDQLDELSKTFKEHTYNTNDLIIKKGDNIKNLIYISKGVVHEKNGELSDQDAPKIKNKAGDIIGLQFITKNEGRSFTN